MSTGEHKCGSCQEEFKCKGQLAIDPRLCYCDQDVCIVEGDVRPKLVFYCCSGCYIDQYWSDDEVDYHEKND